jgi:hypothetical protein
MMHSEYGWLIVKTNFLVACRRWEGVTADFLDSFPRIALTRSKIASLPMVMDTYGSEKGYEP